MVWAAVASVAFGAASSWSAATLQKAQYDAQNIINRANTEGQNRVNQANADAANAVRKANNAFQAAQASLQNTLRSIDNKEKLAAFGDRYNALETNQTRIMDKMVRGSLASQLRSAANLGALRAQAAARGVGGSSATIMRSVANLAAGHERTQIKENMKYVSYDALLQKSGLIRTSISSLDLGQSLPNLDYGINVAPLAQSPINPGDYINPTGQALMNTLGNHMGAILTAANALGTPSRQSYSVNPSLNLGTTVGKPSEFSASSSYFNMA